jgi:small-conductance mechanosensitive channel
LSHPQLWSRADFAISKADYLFGQLGVPRILEHIERNINSIVEFVNHIDELYLADLSEKSNDNDARMSKVLAAASLTLTILILPSFWADIGQILNNQLAYYKPLLPTIETVGDFLAAFLIASAILLLVIAFQLGKQIKGALKKLVEDRLKTRYLPGSRKTV